MVEDTSRYNSGLQCLGCRDGLGLCDLALSGRHDVMFNINIPMKTPPKSLFVVLVSGKRVVAMMTKAGGDRTK